MYQVGFLFFVFWNSQQYDAHMCKEKENGGGGRVPPVTDSLHDMKRLVVVSAGAHKIHYKQNNNNGDARPTSPPWFPCTQQQFQKYHTGTVPECMEDRG